jgi:hypothetical protein
VKISSSVSISLATEPTYYQKQLMKNVIDINGNGSNKIVKEHVSTQIKIRGNFYPKVKPRSRTLQKKNKKLTETNLDVMDSDNRTLIGNDDGSTNANTRGT